MVGLVLVCLLTGMLGVYSASACTGMGLTYRPGDSGGVRYGTQSGFGGELLFSYSDHTYENSKYTYLELQPSVLYRFKGSSDTSPYVGLGYVHYTDTYQSSSSGLYKLSGFCLLAGIEYFLNEKFSVDLRATAYFNSWKDTWGSYEENGARSGIYVDMGVSIYR